LPFFIDFITSGFSDSFVLLDFATLVCLFVFEPFGRQLFGFPTVFFSNSLDQILQGIFAGLFGKSMSISFHFDSKLVLKVYHSIYYRTVSIQYNSITEVFKDADYKSGVILS
jgi:hypothetical protein